MTHVVKHREYFAPPHARIVWQQEITGEVSLYLLGNNQIVDTETLFFVGSEPDAEKASYAARSAAKIAAQIHCPVKFQV